MMMIVCQKLKKETEALESPPMPGALGQRIFTEISKEAWQMWVARQTVLINEYRLVLTDINARNFLRQEMEKFLFGDEGELPKEYVPIPEKNN